jgi:hypothetical protein
VRLIALYDRLEEAILKVDSDDILWLDVDSCAQDFRAFDKVLPNCVYAIHDYSMMGFPTGALYTSTIEQKKQLRASYVRKAEFHHAHKAPIWNGEFGPVYANPKEEADADRIKRCELLGEQLKIYAEEQICWAIWLYKDIGLQGMVYTSPDSAWYTLIQPFLEKKKRLQLDQLGKYPSWEIDAILGLVREMVDEEKVANWYPSHWKTVRHVDRNILHTLLSEAVQIEFANLFAGKTFEELAISFHFYKCEQRGSLNQIMSSFAK